MAAARAQAPEPLYTADDIVRIFAERSTNPRGLTQNAFRAEGQISPRDWLSMKSDIYQDVPGANLSVLWSRELREDSDLELKFDYDRTRGYAANLETYDLNLQHHLARNPLGQIAWGVGFDETMTTGFIHNELSFAQDKVRLSLGTELESYESEAFGMQPSGRLAWKPTGLQTMWASVSSTAYEVGYRVQPQRALSVSMATFYSDYGHTTNFEAVTEGEPLEDAYGTAVTADFQATSRWKLSASQTEVSFAANAAPIPKRLLSLRSSLELPSKTQVDATYRRASRIDGVDAPTGYDELEVRFAWRPRTAFELSLSGRNLLNDQRPQIAPFVAGIAGAPPEGRAAQANVAWSF
jgi:iron complex outermembrane receptor protein